MKTLAELKQKAPRLSVCMIVKNEERFLAQCLESIKDVASEIIIVDTGSTDRTMEIAREYGAKVFEHPWQKDFSLHRNQSIGYATGDWILQIDADEELVAESRAELLNLITNAPEHINGYAVVIQDYFQDGRKNFSFNFPRIFRNGVGVRYIGIVHNQVDIPGVVDFSSVRLNHYGYDLDRKTMLRKYKRSVDLLRKVVREQPDSAEAWYYLTNAYSQYHRHEKCIEAAGRVLEIVQNEPNPPIMLVGIYFPYITSLAALKRFDEALEVAWKALEVYPENVDVYYCLARIKYIQHQFVEAIEYGEKYFELVRWYKEDLRRLKTISLYTLESISDTEFWLSVSHAALGDVEQARVLFQKACQHAGIRVKQLIEAIHNFLALNQNELARYAVKYVLRHGPAKPAVVAALIQELAVVDQFGWLAGETIRTADLVGAPGTEQQCAFIDWVAGNAESALRWAENNLASGEMDGLAELIAADLKNVATPEGLSGLVVAMDIIASCGILPELDDQEANKDLGRLQTELEIIVKLRAMHDALVNEHPDELVAVLQEIAEITEISLPQHWEDIAQLAGVLIDLAEACDTKLMSDAGYLALSLAGHYFPHLAQLQAVVYKRQIARAQRDAGCNPYQRMAAKFLLRTDLNSEIKSISKERGADRINATVSPDVAAVR